MSERFDPLYLKYILSLIHSKYQALPLKRLLSKPPQYGANEEGVLRTDLLQPRYIRITDIDEFGILKKELGFTAKVIDKKYILNENDLLLARSGNTVGKSYIHKKENIAEECFFAGYMIRFVLNHELIMPDFVFYFTQLNPYKNWVNAIKRPTGQPNINAEEYKELKVPILKLTEQKKIVSILNDAYEGYKQSLNKAILLLNSIDDYLLKELGIKLPKNKWSVLKYRVFLSNITEVAQQRLDPKGHHPYYDLLKESIKKCRYSVKPLTNLISHFCNGDWGIDEEKIENPKLFERCLVIRSTEIDNEFNINFESGREKFRFISKRKLETFNIKNNDILIERSGGSPDQPVGRVAFIEKPYINNTRISFGNFLSKIKVNQEVDSSYLFNFLKTIHNIGLTEVMQTQTHGIRNLLIREYLSQFIPIPQLKKQHQIAEHIAQIRSEAKRMREEANKQLEEAKKEVEKMILGN
ncbi:MAG: restriction endonuclease subunit S [Chlorobi bacterium]|nr:restriction endonuclease subunit S [Chlorobiota bacterium]MCI0714712.1 restriction endonuclease subunit S [Chlorobiota bacterium]